MKRKRETERAATNTIKRKDSKRDRQTNREKKKKKKETPGQV